MSNKTPAVTVIDLGDPANVNVGLELMQQDVMQLESTRFKGRQVIVRLDGGILAYYTTNLRVRTRSTLHKHLLGYVTFGPSATGSVNGLPLRPDLMLAVPPSQEVGFVAEPGYESVTFLLQPEDIATHLAIRDRDRSFQAPSTVQALSIANSIEGGLFAWGKRLVDAAIVQPELFNEGMAQRSAAQIDLMEALLSTLTTTSPRKPVRSERTKQGQSAIVRLAERYALENTADRLFVTDLCRVADVSERTLEYAFRTVMGMSPVAYLTRLRLHRVRQALLAAKPGTTTVTTEALNWGFWHFGEFSRTYKECFAELPSDTLRAASGGASGGASS